MAEKKLSPELRFPDFEGEWVEKKLGSISEKIGSGKTPKGGDKVYQSEGIPFIRSQNVFDNGLYLDETHIPEEVHKEMNGSKVFPNDILLNITGGSIGRSCIVPKHFKEGNVNQHVSIIRLKKDNPLFVQLFLASSRGQKLIFQGQTGSGREGLNFEAIKAFKIHIPQLQEQQKIASFLTAVNQRIQLLQKMKSKLEEYKKGVMQRLFSQEIRFKDENGNDFPDWEEKRLGDVSHKIMYGMNASAISFDGKHKYLRITDIDEGTRKFNPNPVTSPDGKIENKFKLSEGDIVFARTGASVGKSYLYNETDGDLYFAGFLIKFSIINANPNFVFLQTLNDSFNRWVKVMSMRSGQPGINAEEFKTFKIHFPSLPEQQKIASFLSSLDRKIEQVGLQIEKTQAWKKGLLQKMFV